MVSQSIEPELPKFKSTGKIISFALLTLSTKGYGSRFVIHSIYLSTALQRAALTSSRQLRYEQAKHVDGLQSDGWIFLKCFRSRVMAGSL